MIINISTFNCLGVVFSAVLNSKRPVLSWLSIGKTFFISSLGSVLHLMPESPPYLFSFIIAVLRRGHVSPGFPRGEVLVSGPVVQQTIYYINSTNPGLKFGPMFLFSTFTGTYRFDLLFKVHYFFLGKSIWQYSNKIKTRKLFLGKKITAWFFQCLLTQSQQ